MKKRATAKHDIYVRTSTFARATVECYTPFYIEGTESIGAIKGDCFDVVQKYDDGILLSSRKTDTVIWVDRQLLYNFNLCRRILRFA